MSELIEILAPPVLQVAETTAGIAHGVPAGGTTGQVLLKTSNTNWAIAWGDQTGSGDGVISVNTRTGAVVLTKADVGLTNADNTADTAKPVSTIQQTALNLKADDSAVIKLTGAQTVAGIKTFSSSPIVPTPTTGTQVANKDYVDSAAGGGGTWGSIIGTLSAQTDLNSALALKAPLASPTFTGTVAGITKTMVGLASVDNTADMAKPVSTAQQAAITLKADDAAVVKLTGAQTVAGIKTFSSAPVVPDSSFAIAKTTSLQTTLDAKALDSVVVKLTGAQTVAGVKTFSSIPVVPTDSFPITAVIGLDATLTNVAYVGQDLGDFSGTIDLTSMAPGGIYVHRYNTGTSSWPNRPTSRTDLTVAWLGPVVPTIGGTGALADVDLVWLT